MVGGESSWWRDDWIPVYMSPKQLTALEGRKMRSRGGRR